MRIVRVINSLHDGGVQIRLLKVTRDLVRRGHDVTVVCTVEEGPNAAALREEGVGVTVLAMRKWKSVSYWARLARLLRSLKPDVVHSHLFRQNAPATIAARLAGVRRVYAQIHLVNTYRNREWVRTDQFLSRFRTAMLAVSEGVAADIRHALAPWPPPRLKVLYNGVDLDPFRQLDRDLCRSEVRKQFGLSPEAVVIGTAARLHPEKNQMMLIRAFKGISRTHPEACLLIAGQGDLQSQLEEEIRASKLGNRVILCGMRRDIPRFLTACDIFTLPSIQEGFSNAILEAMASGIPVVASDTGGASEIIDDGRNGFVCPVGDEGTLRERLADLVGSPEDAIRMGRNNLRDVARFSHEAMIDNTLGLYTGDTT